MDINYELYKVFYHVASSLSFSEASKQLFISQSAVSQSIKTLEKKIGQPLFIRSTKKVQLTPAGELLLQHIEPAMHLIQRGEEQIQNVNDTQLGQLHISASDTICRYFLVPYIKKFHQLYPDVPIRITNAPSKSCVDLLEQGQVDIIISNNPNTRLQPSYITKTLSVFQDVFVANPAYFPQTTKQMTFKEISELPILMLGKNSTTSEYLHQIFLDNRLDLVPAFQLYSNDLLIDLARIGLGLAFVPDYCIRKSTKELQIVNTKETLPRRRLVAATHPTLPLSASADAFLALLPDVATA